MNTVSAQIWRSPGGIERVYGLGPPHDPKATPLLVVSDFWEALQRHTYVRNEDRPWVEYEPLY